MIAQALTPEDRLRAAPFLQMIPGVCEDGFWRRVERGDYAPLLLLRYDSGHELLRDGQEDQEGSGIGSAPERGRVQKDSTCIHPSPRSAAQRPGGLRPDPLGKNRGDRRTPVGLLVASVVEHDDARELVVQLATSPGVASRERNGLLWLFRHLAEVNDCRRIVFESKRKGWVKIARSLGFTPETIVRCRMEV